MSALLSSIPITVITGFLGSGKTTLLSSLLKKEEMTNTAVVINEFGEVGLDHALIERSNENVVELQNGCICCTIREDLLETLLDLVDRMAKGKIPSFDRLIIETTGLADPVPIIHTLISSVDLQRIYSLDGVITLVDAVNGESTLDNHEESVKQIAIAERIILSKTDLTDENTQDSLTKHLQAINPAATIIPSSIDGDIPTSALFGLGTYDPYSKSQDVRNWLAIDKVEQQHAHPHDEHAHHHHNVNRHGKDIQSFAMTTNDPIEMESFNFFLHVLAGQVGPDLLRVKGIVNIVGEKRPAIIHGVQHIFHPVRWLNEWPDDDLRTRVVFITRNIQKKQVEGFFNSLMQAIEDHKKSNSSLQTKTA